MSYEQKQQQKARRSKRLALRHTKRRHAHDTPELTAIRKGAR